MHGSAHERAKDRRRHGPRAAGGFPQGHRIRRRCREPLDRHHPVGKNEWICWVTSAKKEETRKRRIEAGIDKLRGGMRRPCCWPGCPHR